MEQNMIPEIEKNLSKYISLILESEYIVDRLGNIIYKEGGRLRAINEIKRVLSEFSLKYKIPQKDIIQCLVESYASMKNSNNMEYNELLYVLNDIETGEKENIDSDNAEKYKSEI